MPCDDSTVNSERTLVIIPTYCESSNIGSLIPVVLSLGDDIDILVIDDSSPDGTADVVRGLSEENRRVKLKVRPAKSGLGTAYVEGFREAIQSRYRCVIQMDADFSHEYEAIPALITCAESADFVIGSRYVQGGSTPTWSVKRKLLSRSANMLCRIILGLRIRDITSGFKCIRVEALSRIRLDRLSCSGFGFQCELLHWAVLAGLRVIEFPTKFIDRQKGKSKMNAFIIVEALLRILRLRFTKNSRG